MDLNLQPIDQQTGERVRTYLDTLAKPPGSLGNVEDLLVQLAEITGDDFPIVSPPGIIIFAADNGVTQEGVSAFPQEVTAQMVTTFLSGGSAISRLSQSIQAKLKIVDIGVATEIHDGDLINKKVRHGTANFCTENAMTREETLQAIEIGKAEMAEMINHEGIRCLIPGDMGIGNSTTSSALLSVFTGSSVDDVTGRGTGIDTDTLQHKRHVIKQAITLRQPDPNDPIDVLSKVGGLDIAGIAGAIMTAAAHRIPVLLDGLISTTAALAAQQINPNIADYLILGHRSAEMGHDIAIQHLQKQPLLDLGLRLGEGSGAALTFPIMENATRLLAEMSTFETAGVSNRDDL